MKKKKTGKWKHYSFVDYLTRQNFSIWWHPTEGNVDMFLDGVLQGRPKRNKKLKHDVLD